MTQQTDKVREAFENWWKASHQMPCENQFGAVRDSWNVWQASRTAALNEQSAEIERLRTFITNHSEQLGAEFEKVRHENLWNLYEETPPKDIP